MSSATSASALGAFQASLSVLLTLSYGVLAARLRVMTSGTAKDVSALCINMFLPALLITNVGSQINADNFTNYVPVFIWAIVYAVISMLLGKLAVKAFGLPSWIAPACAFNNTTSLPLLLTKSLTTTGILNSIAGGDVERAVERAQSYFLINSMVSNAATLAIRPKLLGSSEDEGGDDEEAPQKQNDNADEITPLLPKPITNGISSAEATLVSRFRRLPSRLQRSLSYMGSLLTPTLWGAVIAVTVGLVPPVHRALFAPSKSGGWLNAWLTDSLRNIGDLFTALQMFVVGSKLSDSLTSRTAVSPPKTALAFIFIIRFVFWGVVSIPTVYFLAVKTRVLNDDPMLWWSMMLMPIGPPAMILSSLAEVAGLRQEGKMMIARTLGYAYAVTPIIFVAVVAALKACEEILAQRAASKGEQEIGVLG